MNRLWLFAVALTSLLVLAAPPQKPPKERVVKTPSEPVRLELFREVQRPSQGAAPKRVIERCELALPDGGTEALLKQPLEVLPYFQHEAPPITVAEFFAAQRDRYGMAHYKMFPQSIWPYLSTPDAKRAEFDTLAGAKGLAEKRAVVIWQGEGVWYVDRVYYRLAKLDVASLTPGPCHDVVEATWQEFVRHSPIVMQRLLEFRDDRRQPDFPSIDAKVPSIELQLTPGMPNTRSFVFRVFPDGRAGSDDLSAKPATLNATPLLVRGARLMAARVAAIRAGRPEPEALEPFAHDQQQRILSLHFDTGSQRITLTEKTSPEVKAFAEEVAKTFGLSLSADR